MRNNVKILLIILLLIVTRSYVIGQDEADKQAAQEVVEKTKSENTPNDESEEKKINDVKKEGAVKETKPVMEKKPLQEKVRKAAREAESENESVRTEQTPIADDRPSFELNDSVMQIPLGDSTLERIPGIKLKKEDSGDIVAIPDDIAKESEGKDKAKGLFGMSESASEIVTKGSVILLILFIIALYRMRSQGLSKR